MPHSASVIHVTLRVETPLITISNASTRTAEREGWTPMEVLDEALVEYLDRRGCPP